VIAEPRTHFVLPADLNAAEPPEARGLDRDHVRLLVATKDSVEHAAFDALGNYLRPGDLLVVNTSGTFAAAADGVRIAGDGVQQVVVHFSTRLDDGDWVVELRTAPDAARPMLAARPGDRVELAGETLHLVAPYLPGGGATTKGLAPEVPGAKNGPGGSAYEGSGVRLWRARTSTPVAGFLERHGRPIRYAYVDRPWPLASYQTVFATEAGSAEMPSAGRPFSAELVTRLVSAGVLIAPIMLHTGVSSLESHEPPSPERYDVPAATAELVAWTKARGGRVVAVGTTVVRALETAARPDGSITASKGWTELVLGPDRPAYVVDGLVTGMHAPDASHLLLLEAVAGADLVQRAYDAALERRYLWHEFGDLTLLLP
jgi:S-adenosylmethionine:tRNA ribosyltransferase-isomerase